MNWDQAIERAVGLHQAGELGAAEKIYRQILALDPLEPRALHLLGVVAHQVGEDQAAVQLISRAISLVRGEAGFHCNLGEALRCLGQFDDAVREYRTATQLDPRDFRSFGNLGIALAEQKKFDEAIVACRQAIQLHPEFAEGHHNLGNALMGQTKFKEAIGSFRRAISIRPGLAEAHCNLGICLREVGELAEAVEAYQRAIELNPRNSTPYNNLGVVLSALNRQAEAIAVYRKGLEQRENVAEMHHNLAQAYQLAGQLDLALGSIRRALELKPDSGDLWLGLGNIQRDRGVYDESLAALDRAVAMEPGKSSFQSNRLMSLLYDPKFDAGRVFEEHVRWGEQFAEPLLGSTVAYSNDRTPGRRLRVGYVSPDFKMHPVGQFLAALLEHQDHQQFEIFCYSDVAAADPMTDRLRACADHWRNLVGLTDEEADALVRRDAVDILIDLAGHSQRNRLGMFARKPAPVQISYLGYPASTGMRAMDYRLTDALADPPGVGDALCVEKLVRLPVCAWCYSAPMFSAEVSVSPIASGKSVCFGSFNYFAKIGEPTVAMWVEILRRIPDSRLLVKNVAMSDPAVRRSFQERLSAGGIRSDRLELRGYDPDPAKHFSVYGLVDIALDSFPYHGTTTTCDVMWMGVPVVTRGGDSHISRVGVSLLRQVGLEDLIARSAEEYVAIAVELEGNRARLAELRGALRSTMRESPLMDGRRFARDVEEAYQKVWENWRCV